MSRGAGILALGLVLAFVLVFSRLNGAERVTLDLGLTVFYRVPVTWIAFGSLLLGMGVMLLAGLHADLKVRRYLRDRLARGEPGDEGSSEAAAVDRLQQDLFQGGPPPLVGPRAPEGGRPPSPRLESEGAAQREPVEPLGTDPPPGAVAPPRADPPPGAVAPPRADPPPGPVAPPRTDLPPDPVAPPRTDPPPGPVEPPRADLPPGPVAPPRAAGPPGSDPPPGEVR